MVNNFIMNSTNHTPTILNNVKIFEKFKCFDSAVKKSQSEELGSRHDFELPKIFPAFPMIMSHVLRVMEKVYRWGNFCMLGSQGPNPGIISVKIYLTKVNTRLVDPITQKPIDIIPIPRGLIDNIEKLKVIVSQIHV